MRELNFNKKSLHFLIATKLGGYRVPFYDVDYEYAYGDSPDICTYLRHVAAGTLWGCLCVAVGLIIASMSIDMLLGIWFSFITGTFFFSEVGQVALGAYGLLILFAIMTKVAKWRDDVRYRNRHHKETKPDNFLKNAYTSWKNNYCVKINFKD